LWWAGFLKCRQRNAYLNRVLRKTSLFFALTSGYAVQTGFRHLSFLTAYVGWVGALAETQHGRLRKAGFINPSLPLLKTSVPGTANGTKEALCNISW
jgi:hypothetical protein